MRDSDSTGNNTSVTDQHAEARLISRLKACQKLTLDHIKPEFDQFIEAYQKQLLEQADKAVSNQQQSDWFVMQREVKQRRDEFSQRFLAALAEGFIKFKNQQLDTRTGEEKYQGDMLSLVDNDDLEETIAISSITHRAENHYAEPLWALNQRFSVLNNGRKVADRSNPLGPIQYCESLRRALERMPLETKAKIIAYKTFDQVVIPRLGDTFDAANDYLKEEGILTNLRYNPASSEAPPVPQVEEIVDESWSADVSGGTPPPTFTRARPLVNQPDASLPTEQYQGHLVSAIRALQGHLSQFGQPMGAPAGGGVTPPAPAMGASAGFMQPGAAPAAGFHGQGQPAASGSVPQHTYSNHQLVSVLGAIQEQVSGSSGVLMSGDSVPPPVNIAINQRLVEKLKAEIDAEGEVGDDDMQTIDLVGMLFDYMLSDDNLPDSVKAILSYLHTPFLKIAFIDKNFFEQVEHPARLLLNSLAEAGVKWVGNDGSSQFDIYSKIKSTVSRVLEEFQNDVRLFAELLLEFSSYTKKLERRQDLVERRAMEKVQGEEKLREVKVKVNQTIRSRTDGRELPSAALLLLLQPWADFLAFILLRYGENSDAWRRAVQVIDDLLWSIEPKQTPMEKIQLEETRKHLLETIEKGFETIGYDPAKGKKLLEAMSSLHAMALKSRQVESAPQPVREKLESLAATRAGDVGQPLDKPSPQEQEMIENLKMIEFGTWFEFTGGKRLKIAWHNSRTSHYMLVDQMGKKVAMKSALELARDMLSGEAKVIAGSTKPFFERALENIFQSLNHKAETISGGRDE